MNKKQLHDRQQMFCKYPPKDIRLFGVVWRIIVYSILLIIFLILFIFGVRLKKVNEGREIWRYYIKPFGE